VLSCRASLPLSRQTLNFAAGIIRRHRISTGSLWRKLNPGQQALLVLVYLRKGETFASLAAGFGVGTTTAWRAPRCPVGGGAGAPLAGPGIRPGRAKVAAEEEAQEGAWAEPATGDEFRSPARSALPGHRREGDSKVGAAEVVMEGIVFGESPRWHDGRLWFSDWGANQVIALGTDGSHEVVATVASFPMCIDFLPDGRLLVVDSAQRRLLRREPGGSLVTHATCPGSRISRGMTSWSMIGATPTSIPSASIFPAASSRPAWSCLPRRTAVSARSPATSRSPTGWRSPRTAER